MAVPYTFANATTSIPLSQLDSNFATAITLGNTAVYLGNTTTSFGNVTLTNATISSGTANVSTLTAPVHNSATTISLQTNGSTTGLYIDASQNVGIGTSSPVNNGAGYNTVTVNGSNGGIFQTQYGSTNAIQLYGNATANYLNGQTNLPFIFGVNNTERMRIDSSGNLLVGTTSTQSSFKQLVAYSGSVANGIAVQDTTTTSGTTFFGCMNSSNTVIGTITRNGTTNAINFNTTSDYRLKSNVQPIRDGLDRITKLNPITHDWVGSEGKGEGFIAHELQAVIPYAVTGEKDAVDKDGKPVYQGVDYSKIVVHLVAAIQELSAEVTALKAKVGA